jgi:IS5 family transposase
MSITLSSLSSEQLRRAADLKEEIEALNKELASFLGTPASIPAKAPKKRGMSAAGRIAVAAAQKARWAKIKEVKPAAKALAKKRTMSAAGRARISAAAKARWTKAKAAGKKRL